MVNQLGTIRLTGEASVRFANSLFRPTQEAIERHNRVIDQIDKDVEINNNEDGFSVDSASLDLSFLKEAPSTRCIEVELIIEIKISSSFISCTASADSALPVSLRGRSQYVKPVRSVVLPCAA